MSAQDTVEKKKRRRRRRRKDEDVEVEDAVEVETEDEVDDDEDDDDSASEENLTVRKGRATPSRRKRQAEATGASGNVLTRVSSGTVEYFQGVMAELRKVHWPTRDEVQRLTVIVIVVVTAFAIVLGGLSFLFTELFSFGFEDPIILGVTLAVLLVLGFGYLAYTHRQE